ncbi:AlpA family transcriptional regulator [Amphritea sp. 1_MG-2023]|uniref:helix-turn-helix transcriptional regulator n=1 Tax=Amphritea sp. 1_MG-2023 TaxID=3062670 RepID=UPI0026E3241F|nr:AlpA family transcriptional regulator [Amphritea sp. 1_MG-2023]MDO6562638.1 AlpA family transcriptional regulator [Amphritea sp. 1_MG-2023]
MRLLRLPEVQKATALSRSSVYRLMNAGTFPASIQLSAKSIAWVEEEVQNWIQQRIAERDSSSTSM